MQNSFQKAEQEFFRLRGLFVTGNLGADEFDAALQQLQVRDEEGRVWMIGANTGRWYYAPTPQWIEAEPHTPEFSDDASEESENALAFPGYTLLNPASSNDAASLDVASFESAGDARVTIDVPQTPPPFLPERAREGLVSKRLVFALFGVGIALAILAGILLDAFNIQNPLSASADGKLLPTRIVPHNTASSLVALAPSATATRHVEITPFGTQVPVTATPALVIEPTSTEPVLTVIPTITPNKNPGKAPEAKSSLPPAVYVTNIRVSPFPPPRQGQVTFTASFWNTNRESVPMNWRIILLDPNRARNKDFGESPFAGITVPPGRTEYSITYMPVNNGGPCMTLQALAARRNDDNSRIFLMGTSGGPYAAGFTFC